ncbi:hypothetical protein LC040_04010 [Bacillus tianshenii]|nr:hypothetical protein LC040_04010 [Bacillus tianshenii]
MKLRLFLQAMKQVCAAFKAKGKPCFVGHVAAALVDAKFPKLPEHVTRFYQIISQMKESGMEIPPYMAISQRVLKLLTARHLTLTIASLDTFESMLFAIQELVDRIELTVGDKSDIEVGSANLSVLKTNGTIVVTGRGFVQTDAYAGQEILFRKTTAAIHGGKVIAEQAIYAGSIGSERGRAPLVRAGKQLTANKVHQAKLIIGKKHVLVADELHQLTCLWDANEEKMTCNQEIETDVFVNST